MARTGRHDATCSSGDADYAMGGVPGQVPFHRGVHQKMARGAVRDWPDRTRPRGLAQKLPPGSGVEDHLQR